MPLFSREKLFEKPQGKQPESSPKGAGSASSAEARLTPDLSAEASAQAEEQAEREKLIKEREEILELQNNLRKLLDDRLPFAQGATKEEKLQNLENEAELEEVKALIDQINKRKAEFSEKVNPFERLINFSEQYQSQKNILTEAGILEELESGELGIKGIDGKEYKFPQKQEVAKRLKEKRELLESKIEHGFTRLLIVPFAMPLNELIQKYGNLLIKHYEEAKLFAPKNDPSDPDEPLELDTDGWIWNSPSNSSADANGRLVYYPEEFDQKNHKGKTKAQILEEDSDAGFKIVILEADPIIPRERTGKETQDKDGNKRHQIEANKTPEEYLKMLKKDPQYKGEQGLTPEDWLTLAISNLQEKNEVTDDYLGGEKGNRKGSISYNIGTYFLVSGSVPITYWDRNFRRTNLDISSSGYRDPKFGLRSAVGV